MYAVSNAFHTAVQNGNKQIPLLIFNDAVFTADDIKSGTGIAFHDRFNTTESISIGQTPSNDISFTLFNDKQLLNNYNFGEFLATIGVQLGTSSYTASGSCYLVTSNTYVGYNSSPYLTRGGSAVSSPPNWPVKSLLGYNGKVYAFGASGQYAVYNDSTGANVTSSNTVNAFMLDKATSFWQGKGIYYNNRILYIYQNGIREQYEFCPLGKFIAVRPNTPDKIIVSMTCSDLMQKFDVDMPPAATLGLTYPITISALFTAICTYVGLPYTTSTFINSTATVASEPEEFADSTVRTVLGWIAEAAGSNARINRDGQVELSWVRSVSLTCDENDYSDFAPYWYETRKVTKLYNRNTSEVSENIYGSGDEAYLIQDNPLIPVVTATSTETQEGG